MHPKHRGLVGIAILGVVLSGVIVESQDLTRYRDFELGSSVAAVSSRTGDVGSELKAIHQRPAVIQQLTWRPGYSARTTDTASIDRMTFDFYNDQLFRVSVDYDRRQTEGLVDADMVASISSVYGTPVTAVASRTQPADTDEDAGITVATWSAAGNSVKLYRFSSYDTTFRLAITAEPIAALARTAAARAVVLDAREAPQREAAREKKEAEDRRAAEEKARSTNRATFRP